MIRRYQWQGGATAQEISTRQLPAGVVAVDKGTNPVLRDLELIEGGDPQNPIPTAAVQDLDEFMASIGWSFVQEDPVDAISDLCVVQDFDTRITVDVSTTAAPPNWGDLFAVALTVGGNGTNIVTALCTASCFADGDPATIRLVLRDDQGTDQELTHPGYVFSSQNKDLGAGAVSGSLGNLPPGQYEVVLQGNIVAGNLAIQAQTDPADQGANISIRELFKG